MSNWFAQLNKLIAQRESGELDEEEFQDHKKRLWKLQEQQAAFDQRLGEFEAQFAADDIFQMRILELQIESPDLPLASQENILKDKETALLDAVEQAKTRNQAEPQQLAENDHNELDTMDEATLLESTKTLVEQLKSSIFVLRSERLDTEFWTLSNQIEDALYRNGSEAVKSWHQRVLIQQKRLQELT